jgi:hypothetical protein
MISNSITGKIKDGKIEFDSPTGSQIWCEVNEGKEIKISIDKDTKRTDRQGRALYLWFDLIAEAMTEAGYDMRNVIKVPLTPTPYLVKEQMWKPIQEKLFGTKSTAELQIDQIDKIQKIMSEAMARSLKIIVPFPSEPDERF